MNICIVGMNQIFDVDIDKVNKPYLPLASGEWSLNTGISVAVSTGLVAVLLGLYIGSAPLLATLIGSLLLGIAYSVDLPFLRWKRYPVLAMGCILSVRCPFLTLISHRYGFVTSHIPAESLSDAAHTLEVADAAAAGLHSSVCMLLIF